MEKDEEAPLLPNHEEEQKNPDAKKEYGAGITCLAMTALWCQVLFAIISFLLPILAIVLLVYQIYQILGEIPDLLKKWGFK